MDMQPTCRYITVSNYIGLIHMALIIYTLPSIYPHIHTHCVKYY